MVKKIMLHGATDYGSSNYGDYLYGEIVYDLLESKGYEVSFYNPSDFFQMYLKEYRQKQSFTKKQADAILYIPGGYFGEGHNARFRDNLIQFKRFLPLGIWASYFKKPIGVLGIGAGPNNDSLMNYGIKRIINHAQFITVRDRESFDSLKHLSPSAPVHETFDLIISSKLREEKTEQLCQLKREAKDKKIILVHYNHSKKALEKFAESISLFLENNPNYYVVVTSDSILPYEDAYYQEFRKLVRTEDCFQFKYHSPAEMTSLLKMVDVVLTCKLHVGVVATCFNKSVIAIACHPEKTARYYGAIGELQRCESLFDSSVNSIVKKLETFHLKPITIPSELVLKARSSLDYLDLFFEGLVRES